MTFTLCQTVAAVIAGSEAMMGDSAAMFVDALTYLFNLVAERKKSHFEATWIGTTEKDPLKARRIRQRAKRKMVLTMELIPPLISVATLIVVTIFVLRHAIRVLVLDVHRPVSMQGDPNINLMLFFSSLNLFLDFLNVFCFARANHLWGFKTVEENSASSAADHSYESVDTTDELLEATNMQLTANASKAMIQASVGNGGMDGSPDPPGRKGLDILRHMHVDDSSHDEHDEGANLNMCSAYTVSHFERMIDCSLLYCIFD
jgi:Co/Zn/Cd efflux system component